LSPNWPASRKASLTHARVELTRGGTGWTYLRARFEKPLLVLMAVVALVLVIGCANVANLLLARTTVRQREIAVRLAIGASRGRLIRQFLTESILLSILSAVLGIPTAFLTSRALVHTLSNGSQPVIFNLAPNWHVLAFTAAVAIATGIFFGTVPALHASATVPSGTLQENARTSRSRMFSPFVATQVGISLILLIGAGLFVRTLQNLERVDPGFKREGVLIVDLEGRRTAVPQAVLTELRRIPGVLSVSLSTHTPLSGSVWSEPAVPKGQPLPENDTAYFVGAGPGFFETLQIRLVAGRDFTERDSGGAPNIAIINEAFARKYFPGTDAVGHYLSAMVRGWRTTLTIVGIAKDVDFAGLRKAAPPTVYVPYYQLSTHDPSGKDTGNFPSTIEVRALGSLSKTSVAIREALQPKFPNTPLDVQPLSTQVEASLAQERVVALVAGVFGVLALALAFAGVYGLLAYRVARQTREVGIRMALGARPSEILRIVVAQALGMAALGTALGLPVAFGVSQWIKSMLFGLTPTDPATATGAAFMLLLATAIAAYVPARRAASVDPMTALRHE